MSKEHHSECSADENVTKENVPKDPNASIKPNGLDSGILVNYDMLSTLNWVENRTLSPRVYASRYLRPLYCGMVHNISESEARPLPGQARYETIWPPNKFGHAYLVPPYLSFVVWRWRLPDFWLCAASKSVSNIVVMKKVSCDSQREGYRMPWKEYARMLEMFARVIWSIADWLRIDFACASHSKERYQSAKVRQLMGELKEMKMALATGRAREPGDLDLGSAADCGAHADATPRNMRLVVDRLEREFEAVYNELDNLADLQGTGSPQNAPSNAMGGGRGCVCGGVCMCGDTDRLHYGQQANQHREAVLDAAIERTRVLGGRMDSLYAELRSQLAAGKLDVGVWQPCLDNISQGIRQHNSASAKMEDSINSWAEDYKKHVLQRDNLLAAFRTVLQAHGGTEWLTHFNKLERGGGFAHHSDTWRRDGHFHALPGMRHPIGPDY